MKLPQHRSKKKPIIITLIVIVLLAGSVAAAWYFFLRPTDQPQQTPQTTTQETNEAATPTFFTAKDESLGSGFSIRYPKEWTSTHTMATQPTSPTDPQIDETVLTSPSGNVQVVMEVQTNTQIGANCTPDYLELKYLETDSTPNFADGRFAGYVVYFPSFNLYQYHVGLQKNTESIRGVTIENNTDCAFMFSEFIDRESSLPDIGLTRTRLYVRLPELQTGNDLKPGITETQVAEKLSGDEFQQAKEIIRSVTVTDS